MSSRIVTCQSHRAASRMRPTVTMMVWTWMAVLLLIVASRKHGCITEASTLEHPQHDSPEAQIQAEAAAAGDETVCAWGTACHAQKQQQRDLQAEHVESGGDEEQEQPPPAREASTTTTSSSTKNTSTSSGSTSSSSTGASGNPQPMPSTNKQQGHIPFLQKGSLNNNKDGTPQAHFVPPEGFTITARVYTDPNDKLAHFTDDGTGRRITLPYWECGATGSTTSPLPVKHAYFRHALTSSNTHVWSGAEYGPHPQLVVALKPMEITLNSGESKHLNAGDVVLLEDVVQGGHKLKSLSNEPEMTYLLLTLPQHYHHVGKDRISLQKGVCSTTKSNHNDPCDNLQTPSWPQDSTAVSSTGRRLFRTAGQKGAQSVSWDTLIDDDKRLEPWKGERLRRWLLGAVGVSVSTLVADFLGKVAPLWVAVGIGGTCFVAGGTWGFVKGGEYVCTEVDMWRERRKLYLADSQEDDDDNDNNKGSDPLKPMAKPDQQQDSGQVDDDGSTQ